MSLRLFISYRHEDAEGYVGALTLALKGHYGAEVELFVDVVATGVGNDYVTAMLDAADSCDAVLACIGPKWSGSSAAGQRIFKDDDPVRVELRKALSAGIPVYVGLLRQTTQPKAKKSEIPMDLFKLSSARAFVLSDTNLASDVVKLVDHIRSEVRVPQRASALPGTVRIAVAPGRYFTSVETFVDGKSVGRFHLSKTGSFHVCSGAHTVQVKLERNRSNVLPVKVEAGATVGVLLTPSRFMKTMSLALVED